MPGGKKLVNAAELYPLLDETGRELLEQWQRDELVIPNGASSAGNRHLSVRALDPRKLPPHGTSARYARGCECSACRQAHTAYMRTWRGTKAGKA